MLDINLIRKDPDYVKAQLAKREYEVDFTELLAWDARRRELIAENEAVKAERNRIALAGLICGAPPPSRRTCRMLIRVQASASGRTSHFPSANRIRPIPALAVSARNAPSASTHRRATSSAGASARTRSSRRAAKR